METSYPIRNPGRDNDGGNDDGDVGTDPRRTREQDENDRTKRQNPSPNPQPGQAPRTG